MSGRVCPRLCGPAENFVMCFHGQGQAFPSQKENEPVHKTEDNKKSANRPASKGRMRCIKMRREFTSGQKHNQERPGPRRNAALRKLRHRKRESAVPKHGTGDDLTSVKKQDAVKKRRSKRLQCAGAIQCGAGNSRINVKNRPIQRRAGPMTAVYVHNRPSALHEGQMQPGKLEGSASPSAGQGQMPFPWSGLVLTKWESPHRANSRLVFSFQRLEMEISP
jgi:hypothetical protein